MSAAFLIIDGYNLMHAAGMARLNYGPGDLQRCRGEFLRYLARHLTHEERSRATVVFDAQRAPPDVSNEARLEQITILFARDREADALIEELIVEHSAPRRVRVVSSDHRLQRAARRRRAAFVRSDRFVAQLEDRGPVTKEADRPRRQHAKYTGRLSPAETEEWLRYFGLSDGRADQSETSLEAEAERLQDWLDNLPDDER